MMHNVHDQKFSNTIKIRELDHQSLMEISINMGLSLNLEEMIRLKHYFSSLGRDPTETELQAMGQAWSEHCCYKSSKLYLKKYLSGLKTDYTILAMEDDAGIVRIRDDLAYALKMESHNHPSAVEPYGGAATGVGGILRDILCMGAQPIAVIDSLYLGNGKGKRPKGSLNTTFMINNIVGGIRDYGNRVGIPTVAGSLYFDETFEGTPLVNAGCIGILKEKDISRSRVSSTNDVLMLAGGKTGRDGIHGVNFASRNLETDDKENRKAVQLGNPIVKEPLIKAVLEANSLGLIAGMKDLGGGGLSSAAGEMCLAGGAGGEIILDNVILKEKNMGPWEIWISESQERMLLSLREENVQKVREIMEKWGIDNSIIGHSVPGKRMKLYFHGEKVLDLPLTFLTSGPVYAKPYKIQRTHERETVLLKDPEDFEKDLERFLLDFNNSSKFKVIRQYDFTVRGNSVVRPFSGFPNREGPTDGAVMRVSNDRKDGLAITSGCKVTATEVDSYEGTMWTMARAYRNILCLGGEPHSVVDALNFGNPDRVEIMGQFTESVRAIGEFCKYMKLPIVAGNVSLYNQTGGIDIPPVPNILMTGIMEDYEKSLTSDIKDSGSTLYLAGWSSCDLGGSLYLKYRKVKSGTLEKNNMDDLIKLRTFMQKSLDRDLVLSAHDVGTGGLLVSLLEMTFGSGIGFTVDISAISPNRLLNKLYSESGNRIIIEVPNSKEQEVEKVGEGIILKKLGKTGGNRIEIVNDSVTVINEEIEKLRKIWESGLDKIFP
ncbi:phosphoribosylformylglycinamidine synthase subunit PurL [Cuniculiplasma sp. SKW3]|uniref:phosphoribosylformylglycinamidine synthase subunit PurL n=1 Tax=unclassified Cuniculiplasma TaxID=2619706 RepID=UPI003FD67CD9